MVARKLLAVALFIAAAAAPAIAQEIAVGGRVLVPGGTPLPDAEVRFKEVSPEGRCTPRVLSPASKMDNLSSLGSKPKVSGQSMINAPSTGTRGEHLEEVLGRRDLCF